METYTKETDYGTIKIRHKTETKKLDNGFPVKIHYLTKELDMGARRTYESVMAHSTSKDKLKDTYKTEKNLIESENYSLKDLEKLEKQLKKTETQ